MTTEKKPMSLARLQFLAVLIGCAISIPIVRLMTIPPTSWRVAAIFCGIIFGFVAPPAMLLGWLMERNNIKSRLDFERRKVHHQESPANPPPTERELLLSAQKVLEAHRELIEGAHEALDLYKIPRKHEVGNFRSTNSLYTRIRMLGEQRDEYLHESQALRAKFAAMGPEN